MAPATTPTGPLHRPAEPKSSITQPRKKQPQLITDLETSVRLGRIRQSDTKPELIVRQVLHLMGLRFRVRNKDLPGSPDIANQSKKWAVFVHGCFWHRHAGCLRATTPKRNAEFWAEKFERNQERDRRVKRALGQMGYVVVVVWECETRDRRGIETKLMRSLAALRPS